MKIANPFRKLSALDLAKSDLDDARRLLLDAQAKAEYNAHMVQFYSGLISRLSTMIEVNRTSSQS